MTTLTLVLTAAGSVLLLLFLVMVARLHAFVALMIVAIGAGLFSGMPLEQITQTMQNGMGGTLGFLAIVVALGAMFGKILHETGALDQIAVKLLNSFGEKRAHYALGIAGLICALPLFFDVAIVLLIGVVFAVARRTGGNVVRLAIPLFAGVAAAACFLLPGPTPMLLADQMNADFGWMILIGLCAAIPGMILAGPLFGNFISKFVTLELPEDLTEPSIGQSKMPSFGLSLALVLFPLVLVGLKTIAAPMVDPDSKLHAWLVFIGHPFLAILIACLTTVGLVLPVIGELGYSGAQLAALSVCIAGGSIVLSHVNDSGFWLFGKFTGATEAQTLKTWTLMETILGTTGALVGMLFFAFL